MSEPSSSPCGSCCGGPPQRSADGHDHGAGVSSKQFFLVALSGVSLGAGFLAGWWGGGPEWLPTALFALATVAGAVLIVPHALVSLRRLRMDMNLLMTVAVLGAWLIGEGREGAAVVFLFAVAEMLESWSVGRARRAISTLLELTPETAWLVDEGGGTREVSVEEVTPGQRIVIRNGARVPLDGNVLKGASSVNQAPITGESLPVEKGVGDAVFAGSINGEGSLEVEVGKAAGDSMLARMVRLVEEAEEQKAPAQRFVDRFAGYYTPAVFVFALLIWLVPPLLAGGEWGVWGYRALVLLVIACPCALVIATPVSIVSGLTLLARRGVLVKGGAYLEAVGKLRALAVDKTGTITRGEPVVVEVIPWGEEKVEAVLATAAALDAHSTHPLAEAVVAEARSRGLAIAATRDDRALSGRGVQAWIGEHLYFIGNHRWTHDLGLCTPELEARLAQVESQGRSLAILGHAPHETCEGKLLGIIVFGDTLRAEAPEALALLHAVGVEKVVMLSGDNQRTVDVIAAQAGIDEARGDLLPEEKVNQVRELVKRYEYVGMIGDGVNDAPALAVASVGIAMGAVGSDTAIETADMALMNDDLRRLADAIAVGRRTVRVIQFNIAFAIAIKVLFLILAVLGYTSLWLAILADTGATLLVIANALRLLRLKSLN